MDHARLLAASSSIRLTFTINIDSPLRKEYAHTTTTSKGLTMTFFPGVREDSVRIGEYQVKYYDSARERSGHTIVLFHGTGGSAVNNFWALFPMLAQRHRVIAFDFVDPADPEVQRGDYIDQAHAVVEAVSADGPVDIVGYSFGAVVAGSYAARYPQKVKSLTLVAGWLKTDAHQRLRNDTWFALSDSKHPALATFTAFTTYSQDYLNARLPGEIAAVVEGIRKGADRSAKMKFNRSVDISEEVTQIAAPTLIVGCSQDMMVPIKHQYLLFGAIADSRFVAVNSGHGVMTERPSEVFTLIDAFVRNPEAEPAGAVLENDHA
jgi:pimeloyl-ACP methyl ester carboxylesterase